MAAPPEKTIRDLNGRWLLNKSLSGNSERLMALQRVPWIIRKAICLADITIRIKQEGSGRSTTIILENTANFNVKGTVEARKLDWEMTPHEDYIWGRVQGRSKFMPSTQIPSDLLTAGNDEDVILSEVNATNGSWDSQMIWEFAEIGGHRRFVRSVTVNAGSEKASALLVYDYLL